MLHIILLIGKILGIIVASILCILLLLILLALFIPIRYIVNVQVFDSFQFETKVAWMLHLISFRLRYENKEVRMKFKIFGLTFFDNKRVKKNKVKRKKKQKYKTTKITKIKKKKNSKNGNGIKTKESVKRIKTTKTSIKEITTIDEKTSIDKASNKKTSNKKTSNEKISNEKTSINNTSILNGNSSEKLLDKPSINRNTDSKDSSFEEEHFSWFERLKLKILNKIKDLKNVIHTIKEKLKNSIHSFKSMISSINKVKDFFEQEENKNALKMIYLSIKKFIRHIRPRKVKGNFVFGTGDPCLTGQMLAIISIMYPIFQSDIKIVPDFDQMMIEGKGFIRGRIRIITLLIISIKLILNTNFKQLIRNYKNFKEEL